MASVLMIWAWSCLAWDIDLMEYGFLRSVLRRVSVELICVSVFLMKSIGPWSLYV